MKLHRWNEIQEEALNALLVRRVLHTARLTIARLNLKQGCLVPRHSHENEQVSTVESGKLRFIYPGGEIEVGAGESDIKSAIKNIIWPKDYGDVISDDYTKVMNQMVALGMIEARPHPSLPAVSLWFATPYGQTVGSRMAALQRKEDEMPF